jgi:hypothetical protein
MNPCKKGKNVLITAAAYEMLINEFGLKPNQLLAKPPVLEDRVKSPKTNRFIHIGSTAYVKLLADGYKEEELLLRRDGYIMSPESEKLVKVFSKTFNALLEKYELNNLLRLPRVRRGDVKAGVCFNEEYSYNKNVDNVTEQEFIPMPENINVEIVKTKIVLENKVVVLPNLKKPLVLEKIITKKSVDELILNSITPVVVYTSGTFYQSNNLTREDDEERKEAHAFQCAASYFNKGELTSFYEAKEYRLDDDTLSYNYYVQGPLENKVKNIDEHYEFLLGENERSLINIKLEEVDLLSMYSLLCKKYNDKRAKEEIINILHLKFREFENQNEFLKIVKLHTWFISNASLMQMPVKFTKVCDQLVGKNDEIDYENFDKVKMTKDRLKNDIINYYKFIINYLQEKI